MEFELTKSLGSCNGSRLVELEISLDAFSCVTVDGRKSYVKARNLRWNVDINEFSVDALTRQLAVEMNVNHRPDVWYYDKVKGQNVRLVHEEQKALLFDMYAAELKVKLNVVPADLPEDGSSVAQDTRMLPFGHGDNVVPADDPLLMGTHEQCPSTPSQQPHTHTMEYSTSQVGSCSQPSDVTAPNPPKNALTDPADPDDPFDKEEEYVGVDDETMYDVNVPITVTVQPPEPAMFEDDGHVEMDGAEVMQDIEEEDEIADFDPLLYNVSQDPEKPDIRVGALFPDIEAFRKAIRQHAVIKDFEFGKVRTDKTRFIASCAHEDCPWRIYASRLRDERVIMIKKMPFEHDCPTTKLENSKMASQEWVAEKLADWVKKNPGAGAKEAKKKLEEDYNFMLKYSKAWAGMKLAQDMIHGKYEDCFQLLFSWKAEVERKSPGSIVEIELAKINHKYHFHRVFVAFKPCIDGFLAGCRPYVGVDATALNGNYVGQLASATAVDGHNWLYYVAYAVFDSETAENWTWFMQQLRRAIGQPAGLVICSDACKGLEIAVDTVFPDCEYRECMRHLYQNFMKKFRGNVYTDHLYPAARGFTELKFRWHMEKIKEADPSAIEYLDTYHNRIWYRCGFGEASKIDYLTNNISESFNKQIKDFKGLNVCALLDRIRELIMIKFNVRRQVGRLLQGRILPNVIKKLNALSKTIGPHKVAWNTETEAEVTLYNVKAYDQRHTVDLQNRTCSCRVFQVSGKPCIHALAFICSIRVRGVQIQQFVDDYYSVAKFQAAYEGAMPTMTDKTQWVKLDLGFPVLPPIQEKRPPGRPRVQRIRGHLEPGRKVVRCKRCGGNGHFQKTCKLPRPVYPEYVDEEHPEQNTPTKRKRDESVVEEQTIQDDEPLAPENKRVRVKSPAKRKPPAKRKSPANKSPVSPIQDDEPLAPEKEWVRGKSPAKKSPANKSSPMTTRSQGKGKQTEDKGKGKKSKSPVQVKKGKQTEDKGKGKKSKSPVQVKKGKQTEDKEKGKKKSAVKRGKQAKPQIFAPSTNEAVLKPTMQTKRSIMQYLQA